MDRLRTDGRNPSSRKPWGAQADGHRPPQQLASKLVSPFPLVLPQLTEKSNRITKISRRASAVRPGLLHSPDCSRREPETIADEAL
jgi:hypothetical protein